MFIINKQTWLSYCPTIFKIILIYFIFSYMLFSHRLSTNSHRIFDIKLESHCSSLSLIFMDVNYIHICELIIIILINTFELFNY